MRQHVPSCWQPVLANQQSVYCAQTCASYDRKHWFRVPTHYDSQHGVLLIKHKPERVRG